MTSACVWLTGRSGSGKTTIATAVVAELRRRGRAAAVIDEPEARTHLGTDDRAAALAWVAELLVSSGVVAVVAVDEPERSVRERLRQEISAFVEVFVDRGTPTDGYEEPFAPDLRVPTHDRDADASAAQVVSWLEDAGVVGRTP